MSSEAQNIYDNPDFFSAYSTLPRSQGGLSSAPEWPVLQQMVLGCDPRDTTNADHSLLKNKKILDLGCGYGWFSRWARDNGASYIRAIDISEKMINRAKEFEKSPESESVMQPFEIGFETGNLDEISFHESPEQGKYDLVYSSLTFHYVEDISRLYREIGASLKQGGKLVFSVEHPICSAPISPCPDWISVTDEGEDRKVWPLNSYCEEGWRLTSWLGVSGVKKYHRTVETYINLLIESGFTLTGLKDWAPSRQDVSEHPEWADERHRPYFLLISAEKRMS